MPTPIFIVENSLEHLTRWPVLASQLAVALFEGGARFDFDGNVKVQNKILVREGEWLGRNADGLWTRSDPSKPLAFPVFLDPKLRFDDEGGLVILRGMLVARTNMIGADDADLLVPGCALVPGALPVDHDFEGSQGLLPLEEEAEVDQKHVVAVIEEVLDDGVYRIMTTNYFADGGSEAVPPTTIP